MDSGKAEVDKEVKKYQDIQEEISALISQRNKFYQQANENGMVKQELDLLEDDAQASEVFKLIGPVLVKQDVGEARANVGNRLELIQREMGKVEKLIAEKQVAQEAISEKVVEMQQAMQKAAAEGAQEAV
ncbi:unnamed protein product, partial [Phaeothamnion confervicola]